MLNRLLFILLVAAATTGCDLLTSDGTTLVEGRLYDYYSGELLARPVRINVSRAEKLPLQDPRYQPFDSFVSAMNGSFSYRLRKQPNMRYVLSVPPGNVYGWAVPAYAPVGQGARDWVEFRLKPVRHFLRVNIRFLHTLPEGIRITNHIAAPHAPDTRKLADLSFLVARTDTTLLLPAVPEETHRVSATIWYVASDSTFTWSHTVDVTRDTTSVDFNF